MIEKIDELFAKSRRSNKVAPSLLDLLELNLDLRISVRGKTRIPLDYIVAEHYLSYFVFRTEKSGMLLLVSQEFDIIGIIEVSDLTAIKDLELEFSIAEYPEVPTIRFSEIGCLNSIIIKGGALSNMIYIKSIYLCARLFKIIADNCVVLVESQGLQGLPSLYYCKGKFILTGESNFRACSNLRNIGVILNSHIPPRCFENCTHLEEIRLSDEICNYVDQDTTIGSYAFSGCAKLFLKEMFSAANLVVFPQGSFDSNQILCNGDITLIGSNDNVSSHTNLFSN